MNFTRDHICSQTNLLPSPPLFPSLALAPTLRVTIFVCRSVLHDLKLNGLLRFRGCRAGRRKVFVRISDRISHTTCHDRTTSRTSVLVPIVPEQRFLVGSYLKFCSLNARSVRNKSADLVSCVESSGTDIFAVTETWLSEIDDACREPKSPHPGKSCLITHDLIDLVVELLH